MDRKFDKIQSNVIIFFGIFLHRDRPLIVVGPGASAQVNPCIKAALGGISDYEPFWKSAPYDIIGGHVYLDV